MTTPRAHDIAERLAAGQSHRTIAAALGMPPSAVRRTEERLRGMIAAIRAQTRERVAARLADVALTAADTLAAVMARGHPRDQVAAARVALDAYRALMAPAEASSPLPIHDITQFLARLGAAGPTAGGDTLAPAAGTAEPGLPESGG